MTTRTPLPRAEARQLVADSLGQPLEAVPEDAAIGTLAAWDSLGHVRILLALEAALGRRLTTTAIAELRALDDVARLLADGR